jgi:hypothetical protein
MLMTMRAGSFSTLVLLSLGVLLVLGAAVPAGAQVMTAGGDLDVYDDNGGIVGRLVGIQSSRHWVISVEAPDGDVAALRYLSPAPLWGDIEQLVGFDAPNCNGNAYLIGLRGDGARTAAGYTYAAMYLGVYKVDLNTAASVTVVSSVLDNYGVCSNECLSDGFPCQPQLLVHPAEFVATISTAFPFHVRAATSSPSAVPSGVVGIVAGVLGISGALLVRLRRS